MSGSKSEYHKKCTSCENQVQKKKVQKKPSKKSLPLPPPLTSKPFCDCEYCECKNCPDILKMLSITVTDTTCVFGSSARKSKSGNVAKCEKSLQPQRQSVLDVLNPDRDCGCEVMARAIRSNIHMNLGLSELREAVDRRNSQTSNDEHPPK